MMMGKYSSNNHRGWTGHRAETRMLQGLHVVRAFGKLCATYNVTASTTPKSIGIFRGVDDEIPREKPKRATLEHNA